MEAMPRQVRRDNPFQVFLDDRISRRGQQIPLEMCLRIDWERKQIKAFRKATETRRGGLRLYLFYVPGGCP